MHWLLIHFVDSQMLISLQGRRVLITPNTKPGKEIISSLVKAVQGEVCSFLKLYMIRMFMS